jgi:hypothetical protein
LDHTFIRETEKRPADDDMVKERDIHCSKRYPYSPGYRIMLPPALSEPTHHRKMDPPYRYFVTMKAPV